MRFAFAKFVFVRSASGPITLPATSPHPAGNVGLEVEITEFEATRYKVAPVKLADEIVAPRSDAFDKFAPLKFVDVMLEFFKDEEVRFAFERFAFVITTLVKMAPERFAFVKVAFEKVTVFKARLDKFTPLSEAPVRFAPGPIR